jgi:hypothetical protein
MAEIIKDPKTGKVAEAILDHHVDADHPDAVSIPEQADGTKLDALGGLAEPTPEEVFAGAAKPAPKK